MEMSSKDYSFTVLIPIFQLTLLYSMCNNSSTHDEMELTCHLIRESSFKEKFQLKALLLSIFL